MSCFERNKGVLHLTGIDTEHYTDEDFETLWENNMVVVDGEVYEVTYEVKSDESESFAYVNVKKDGTVEFHTQHYNGGGSLEEVLESAQWNEED